MANGWQERICSTHATCPCAHHSMPRRPSSIRRLTPAHPGMAIVLVIALVLRHAGLDGVVDWPRSKRPRPISVCCVQTEGCGLGGLEAGLVEEERASRRMGFRATACSSLPAQTCLHSLTVLSEVEVCLQSFFVVPPSSKRHKPGVLLQVPELHTRAGN